MSITSLTGTTSNGTAFTRWYTSDEAPDAGTAYWCIPDGVTSDIPMVLYCHGADGGANQFATLPAWVPFREWLLDHGRGYMECTGGGAQPWGAPVSRTAYEALFALVDTKIDIGLLYLLGRSMGAVVAHWLYTQSVIATRVSGMIDNSGVSNLAQSYEQGNWTDFMRAAYGATTDAEFYANSVGHDPMLFPASSWDGKKMLTLVGSADTTVPPASHGLALRNHYLGHPTIDLLDTRTGGNHSGTNGSYLQVDAMANFIRLVAGELTTPPPPLRNHRITAGYWYGPTGAKNPINLSPRSSA